MEGLCLIFVLAGSFLISHANGRKTYRDMFPHSHSMKFPPFPGWNPDSNPWDDYLYPPFKSSELKRRKGKPIIAHLTSDSPAMNGSYITFSTSLEFPKCQKEDANGDLVYEDHCDDANGQVRSGYVFNWTSWLDDYGFGKCTDPARCNVFPDRTPFPQSNDWRRRGYVYVWHTMGQYFQTCGGSSSSLKLNTTNITLGAEMMEVLVYRKRDRRKYSPAATDNGVYFVTDKIPLAVNISQRTARQRPENVFVKDADIVFNVLLHDPSNYLQTAATVDFIWDFRDGNQLVTHSNVATHSYSIAGNETVKLRVEAAFRVACPPPTPTPMSFTSPRGTATTVTPPGPETHAVTSKMETTPVATTARFPQTNATTAAAPVVTTGLPSTEPLPTIPTEATPVFTEPALLGHIHAAQAECFRYMYGSFEQEIFIVDQLAAMQPVEASKIVEVTTAKVTNTTVNFLVKCLGSVPTSACTIISDADCRQVRSITCTDVPPTSVCLVTLRRTFPQPGTYCVNITLEGSTSLAQASSHVTIRAAERVSRPLQATEVVLSASAVLVAIFAFIAFMVYKRYKVYVPVRRAVPARERLSGMRAAVFQASEERSRLLADRPPQ